jgi:hypothetical protein
VVEKLSIYLGNVEVYYCVHKHLVLDPMLSQLNSLSTLTFEIVILMVVKMSNVVFWVVMPSNLVVGYQRFRNFITLSKRFILILSSEMVF